MQINREVFRGYDIRGIVGQGIDEDFAELLGKSFASYVQELGETSMIVGHDCRTSSEPLNKALIKGAISTGINVIDIGLATTPMVYYARNHFDIGPAIQITASHNPSEYNGFKMCIEKEEETIFGERIEEIREYTEKGNFKTGNGTLKEQPITEEYIKDIVDRIQLGNRKIKAVVDCGNATPSIVSVETLEKIGVEVVPLYCDLDPSFPNHHPDPNVAENMVDLAKKVQEVGADVGFGFDGDGDRIGIVDDKGNIYFGDIYMLLMWREIIKKYPASPAIVEVKCSQKLWDELEKIGAKPQFIRTGSPYIKAAVKDMNLPFGGEMSGHVCFRDEYYGFDDALYAAARFARMLSNTDKQVSELMADTTQYVTSPEIGKKVDEKVKFELIERAVKYFKDKGFKVIDIDGARVIFDYGWGLVRASNTSPKITLRFEADSQENLEKIKNEFDKMFEEIEK